MVELILRQTGSGCHLTLISDLETHSVGFLHGFFEDSLPDSLLRNNSVIEGFIAPRQGGAIRHAVEAKDRSHLGMVHQPTALGFEAKETPLVHEKEEHN